MTDTIPATGFVRLKQILGDKNADPPRPPIIPISKAAWWNGVKKGAYPAPLKLGPNTTVWRAEDIHQLIADGCWVPEKLDGAA